MYIFEKYEIYIPECIFILLLYIRKCITYKLSTVKEILK